MPPYSWIVLGGALPPGLNIDNSGTMSGTPAAAGKFAFTVQGTDSGNGKIAIPGSISVAAPLNASLIPACTRYCTVELGCVNVCGGFGQVTGGVAPYTYRLTQGPLPSGTTLSGLSLKGTFGGLTGYLQFEVEISDSLGASNLITPTFWMYSHVSLASGTCLKGRVPTCTVKLAYSGGVPGPVPSVVETAWKGGSCSVVAVSICPSPTFSASVAQGFVTVTLTWSANYPQMNGSFTLQVTDSALCASGVHCTAAATLSVA